MHSCKGFADGFQSTALEMHKWLLYPVQRASNVNERLGQTKIREALQAVRPPRGGVIWAT